MYVTIRDPETGDHLYVAIDDKPKSAAGPSGLRRLRNIAAHPQVSLLAQHYDDDWSRLWWVRADGFAAVVEFGNCPKELLAALQAKYPYYAEHPPAGPVIDVDVIDWTGWSFTNS